MSQTTKTPQGLSVTVRVLDTRYAGGRTVTAVFTQTMPIVFAKLLPQWNNGALPQCMTLGCYFDAVPKVPPGVVRVCCDAFGQTITPKTVVVLDHASIHTSEACEDRMPHEKKPGVIMK